MPAGSCRAGYVLCAMLQRGHSLVAWILLLRAILFRYILNLPPGLLRSPNPAPAGKLLGGGGNLFLYCGLDWLLFFDLFCDTNTSSDCRPP